MTLNQNNDIEPWQWTNDEPWQNDDIEPDWAKVAIPPKIPRMAKTMLPVRSGTQQQHLDSIFVKWGVLNYKYNVLIIVTERAS